MKKPQYTLPPAVILIILILYFLFSRSGSNSGTPTTPGNTQAPSSGSKVTQPAGTQIAGSHTWGKQTKTSGCQAVNGLADPACTPGDVMETDISKICQSGYSGGVRNVPDSEKNQVYAEYGIASHTPGQYEVDHLVSLELGGSNDISNLWPELASPKPGFHEKDKVENYMHDQVCAGKISLQQAQVQIATNWLAIYDQIK